MHTDLGSAIYTKCVAEWVEVTAKPFAICSHLLRVHSLPRLDAGWKHLRISLNLVADLTLQCKTLTYEVQEICSAQSRVDSWKT